jgi:hypothetical protein
MFALIANGAVAQIDAAGFPIAAPFAWVDISAVSPTPQVGWSYVAGVFTAPAIAVPSAIDLAQAAYDAAVAAGVQITSTGTPALNGIYSLSQLSLSRITSEQVYLATAAKFTNGGTTRSWLDQTGAPHTFPSTVAFTGFAEAVALYDDALIAALDAGLAGAEWVAPAQPAAIA